MLVQCYDNMQQTQCEFQPSVTKYDFQNVKHNLASNDIYMHISKNIKHINNCFAISLPLQNS